MSVVLLANTAYRDAAQLLVTDASNVATADIAGLNNVVGGPRHIAWSSSDSLARRVVYLNRDAGLGCTHVVVARADQFVGKGLSIRSWSSYPGSMTTEYLQTVFGETLVGRRSQDWVYPLELAGKHAVALSTDSIDHVKDVYKFFVSDGFELSNLLQPTITELPRLSEHFYRRQRYLVDVEWAFTMERLTRAEVETFEALPNLLSEPVFLYDPDGYHVRQKLIHGIIADFQVEVPFDDFYRVNFRLLELRTWP